MGELPHRDKSDQFRSTCFRHKVICSVCVTISTSVVSSPRVCALGMHSREGITLPQQDVVEC